MKIIKRLTALVLCAALAATPALGAGTAGKTLPAVKSYVGYSDVKETNWFYSNVKLCYETGLMEGSGDGTFAPNKILTVAEVATVAARLHELLHGEDGIIEQPADGPWWQNAVNYMNDLAAQQSNSTAARVLAGPQNNASRAECLLILSLVADESVWAPINNLTALPDTDDPTVLLFYNAGILNGVDKYGSFAGERLLSRSEFAAMLSRIADPSLRLTVTLADYSAFTAAGLTPDELLFPGLNAETYLSKVNDLIHLLESVCAGNDMEFNWLNTYGDQTFLDYVKSTALTELGANADQATDAYRNFDVQVYYSRLIDLTGNHL